MSVEQLAVPMLDVGQLVSFDVNPSGALVLLIDDGSTRSVRFGAAEKVTLPRHASQRLLAACGWDHAVAVAPRSVRGHPNAWVVSREGVKAEFFAGDAVEHVIGLGDDGVAMTYFDEGFGSPVTEEGVAVFDLSGHLVNGYRRTTGKTFLDCYAAVGVGKRSVGFLPFPADALIIWNVKNGDEQSHELPEAVRRSIAMTHRGQEWWFFSPTDEPRAVYSWRIGTSQVAAVGEISGRPQGLPGGRFLVLGEQWPSMVTMEST